MDFFQCKSLNDAHAIISEQIRSVKIDSEMVYLPEALGRVSADNLIAPEDLPMFNRSTVDGFAVRSTDTFGVSETVPALFSVTGEVMMGHAAPIQIFSGQAVMIPTGGMMPPGADAVLMLEYAEQPDPETLLVSKVVAPGENVVSKGDDIRCGSTILKQGQLIGPQHVGILAACGFARILVNKAICVAIISSGDELVDIDEKPDSGKIRDINSYALGAMLAEMGCRVLRMGIVRDNYDDFVMKLDVALQSANLVIISGGSSVGSRDYTVAAVNAFGNPGVLFHGIAVKPGKPTIFGMAGGVPVFGLPGHPVAAMTVCEQLVKPAIRLLRGQQQSYGSCRVPAIIARNIASSPGRDDFISVRLKKAGGKYFAEPILGKSGLISTIAEADGIVHIAAENSGLYDGDPVEVCLLNQKE